MGGTDFTLESTNLDHFSPKLEGDVCYFSCPPEFVLHGSSELMCTATGVWSHYEPVCYKPCENIGVRYFLLLNQVQYDQCIIEITHIYVL